MDRLIEDLLRFSRLGRQPLAKRQVSVAALVQEILRELEKDHADRDVEVRVGPLADVVADAPLLKQVLTNLLSNAFKFTGERAHATIDIGCCRREDETVFFIRDNGAGFDMRYADKLFGVFQRLHSAELFPGTGVGLSLVHRIISRHGGRIWAESEIDQGATFHFSLPN
jgi:two-component system, sensor histidine kinase and response regulator